MSFQSDETLKKLLLESFKKNGVKYAEISKCQDFPRIAKIIDVLYILG